MTGRGSQCTMNASGFLATHLNRHYPPPVPRHKSHSDKCKYHDFFHEEFMCITDKTDPEISELAYDSGFDEVQNWIKWWIFIYDRKERVNLEPLQNCTDANQIKKTWKLRKFYCRWDKKNVRNLKWLAGMVTISLEVSEIPRRKKVNEYVI